MLFGEETIALPGGNDSFAPRKAVLSSEVLGCLFLRCVYRVDCQYLIFTIKERRNPVKIQAGPRLGKCDIWNTFQTLHKGYIETPPAMYVN